MAVYFINKFVKTLKGNNNMTKRKIFKFTVILLLTATVLSLICGVHFNNKQKPYECKVVETYFENAGYKVSARYRAVVYVIDLKKTTSIGLTPENYYNATRYKQTGEITGYYFSLKEIDQLREGRDYHDWADITFTIILIVFIISGVLYLLVYHEDEF